MKKLISFVLILALAAGCLGLSAFAAQDIRVTVDGKLVTWTDAEPFIDENDRTLVPLRAVADVLGLDVEWDPAARVAQFSRSYTNSDTGIYSTVTMRFPIGSKTAYVTTSWEQGDAAGGQTYEVVMDTAAIIASDRTYAPIRYLAETFDCSVSWDASTRTVIISHHAYYYNCVSFYADLIGFAFEPAGRYGDLKSVEILSAKVNGKEANIYVYTADELKALNKEYYGYDGAFYAYELTGDFNLEGVRTITVSWVVRETMKDGSTGDFAYEQSYAADGFGGYSRG